MKHSRNHIYIVLQWQQIQERSHVLENKPTFNGVYEVFAEVLGIDKILKVYQYFKGQQINFPTKLFSREYVVEEVLKAYNGKNLNTLSTKFGYSERHLRQLIKDYLENENNKTEEVNSSET